MRPPTAMSLRVARLLALASALTLPGACGDDEPFPACPGEERVPAFCGPEPEQTCRCDDSALLPDGQVFWQFEGTVVAATCRADGSDWETCNCEPTPAPEACVVACQTMRCTEACDDHSVLLCQQRCQHFFREHEARRGAAADEACALAIATLALCNPEDGCSDAPPCDDTPDADAQAELFRSECGSD